MAYGSLKTDNLIYDNSGDQTVTVQSLAEKATTANPTFTGTVTVPTPTAGDNSTKAASTAFVVASFAPKADPAFSGTATGANLTLSGNLTVNGTTTTVAATNTTITDNLLELNSGASSNANDSGILIERGSTGDNAIFAWDESADRFTLGTTTATNDATGNISVSTGTLAANIVGNVTGNVTGNTSGSSGSCTGNAATATTATNVTVADESTDTTCNVLFTTTATGDLPLKSGTNLTFNSSGNGELTCGTFVGSLTGNVTGNCSGSSGSCTGNAATATTATIATNASGLTGSPNITVGTIGCGAITGTSTISDSKGDVRKIPQNSQSSSYTLVASDAGKHIITADAVTIPNNVFAAGDAVTIVNNQGAGAISLTKSITNLYWTADGTNTTRTLGSRGMATILFVSGTAAYISGSGLS